MKRILLTILAIFLRFEKNKERLIDGLVKAIFVYDDYIKVFLTFDDKPIDIPTTEEIENMARASYCHLRSCFLQIRFTRARDNGFDKRIMAECAREELELALVLHQLCRRDSRIGFEASNHYLYTLNDLREKVLNCRYILKKLERND